MSSKLWRPWSIFGAAIIAAAAASTASAQSRAEINAILDKPVDEFNVPAPGRPAQEVFDGLASTYRIPVIIDPAIAGNVAFRVYGTHLRGLLDAICQPHGWHYEIQGDDGSAYLSIQRFITRSYSVDYPQADQTSNSNASVSLSGGEGGGSGSGTNGTSGTSTSTQSSSTSGQGSQAGATGGSSSGSSSVNLTTTSKQNFWERFEADAKSYVQPDELLIVNRLGGIVQLTGSLRTHALLEDYINRLMARVRRHATITVRAIRVDINNSNALGVDLTAALQEIAGEAHIGGSFTPVTIGGTAPYSTTSGTGTVTGAGSSNYGTIGNIAIGSPTVQTVVTAGKVSALVTALSKQGAVTVTDTTTAATLNNQMALIQVTQDLPFFARSNSTNYNPGGSTTTGVPPVETSNYTEQTVSFGSVLEVTPQISDDLVSTIVVAPSVTEFLGTVTSPDLSSTAPNTGTRRYRSTYVLRNHESAVIGAFMEGTKGKQTSGVPGISSIPIIGYMFKTTAGLSSRSEFIIVMTVDAEDGSVPQPRTLAMPLADQARRDLGGAISPELKDELDPQPPQPKPVRGKKAAAVPPASKVELVGSPTS